MRDGVGLYGLDIWISFKHAHICMYHLWAWTPLHSLGFFLHLHVRTTTTQVLPEKFGYAAESWLWSWRIWSSSFRQAISAGRLENRWNVIQKWCGRLKKDGDERKSIEKWVGFWARPRVQTCKLATFFTERDRCYKALQHHALALSFHRSIKGPLLLCTPTPWMCFELFIMEWKAKSAVEASGFWLIEDSLIGTFKLACHCFNVWVVRHWYEIKGKPAIDWETWLGIDQK